MGVELRDLSADQQAELERWEGYRSEGLNQKGIAMWVAMGETVELLMTLVKMEDVQASFEIMRLWEFSWLTFLLRTLPPKIATSAAEFMTPS